MISIIVPTYNRAHLILETLQSISSQTYTHWECIVVDDGSTDTTEVILLDYIKKDKRFQYHKRPSEKQKGANACRNYGFSLSKGEYIQWFDSDDIMKPTHLEKKISVLSQQPKIDYCLCDYQTFTSNIETTLSNKISKLDIGNDIYENYIMGLCSILTMMPLWRKNVFDKVNLFDETLLQSQDLDLYSRLIFKNRKASVLKESLIYVRRENDSITTKNSKLNINIDSFLEVKKRIINRTPENLKIVEATLKIVLGMMRYKLAGKEYKESDRYMYFVTKYSKKITFIKRLKVFKIMIFYTIFKTLKRGDTKFKSLLKL